MTSMPGMDFGRSASVAGSVCASFRHGIWMISFFTLFFSAAGAALGAGHRLRLRRGALVHESFDDAVPGDGAGAIVTRVAHRLRTAAIPRQGVDRGGDRLGL